MQLAFSVNSKDNLLDVFELFVILRAVVLCFNVVLNKTNKGEHNKKKYNQ